MVLIDASTITSVASFVVPARLHRPVTNRLMGLDDLESFRVGDDVLKEELPFLR